MFGYGSEFIHIVEVSYTNIQSQSKINGLLIEALYSYGRSLMGVSTLNVVIY